MNILQIIHDLMPSYGGRMQDNLSPYIAKIKDWKMRDIIDNYLNALQVYDFFQYELKNGRMQSFKNFRKICDYLWHAKEANYLIFRRMTNPHYRKFEDSPKIIPNEDEISFMNNVGLLFHKSLVARELKYILEYYEDSDREIYEETRLELVHVLQQVRELFKKGIKTLLMIFQHQVNNIPLLTYIIENKSLIEKATEMNLQQVLEHILGNKQIDKIFCQVGKFYFESGWKFKAQPMFEQAVKVNPQNQSAQKFLVDIAEENRL